jgi:thioredoxin-related protein
MIRFILFPFCLYMMIQSAFGQDKGIHFERGLTWNEIRAKAKAEHKFIFMDCYTTWCGPCKFMDSQTFPQKEVGEYFNSHFISVRVQMDRTNRDNDTVREWYNDAKMIERTYGIAAYPTMLFFNADGIAVHRIVGSSKDGTEFVGLSTNALDPEKQYYTIVGYYKEHLGDSAFLSRAVNYAISLSDTSSESELADPYFHVLKDPFSKDNLPVLRSLIQSDRPAAFRFFLSNRDRIDQIMGIQFAEAIIMRVIDAKAVNQYFEQGASIPDWNVVLRKEKKQYGVLGERTILGGMTKYYRFRQPDIKKFEKTVDEYMTKFVDQCSAYELNDHAWDVFNFSANRHLLLKALNWSRQSLTNYPNVDWEFVDTYSNLLYKTGSQERDI